MHTHAKFLWLIAVLVVALCPTALFAQAAISPAASIAGQLGTQSSTILSVADFSALTDPDGLLGAPGQYVAKARFTDSAGISGDVEVFANVRDARTRLNSLAGASAVGQEVDVAQGLVIVRLYFLSGDASPYRAALGMALGFA
jgi:hypothetical protein